MRNLKVFLALGAGLAAAVAAACSSSSNNSNNNNDAGTDDSSTVGDDGSTTTTGCLPISADRLCTDHTQTCCLDTSGGLASLISGGKCVAPSACTAAIQVQCLSSATCPTSGQDCCVNTGGIDAGALAALLDSGTGFDAGGFDASGFMIPSDFSFHVACATSCAATDIQACATDAECHGGTCVPLTQLLAADGGIDAGGALGGMGAALIGALGMDKACIPPDAGTTPPTPDSGSGDDSSTTAPDAGTDAPAEAAQ
jgi:hypothetical protein